MSSSLSVTLTHVESSSPKDDGTKVRVGVLVVTDGTKASPSTPTWSALCTLKKCSTGGARTALPTTAPMRIPLASGPTKMRVTLSIETKGLFSSTVVCVMELEAHDLVYNGSLSGPFVGAQRKGGVKWTVEGSIQLVEVGSAIPPLLPPPLEHTSTVPNKELAQPVLNNEMPQPILLPPSVIDLEPLPHRSTAPPAATQLADFPPARDRDHTAQGKQSTSDLPRCVVESLQSLGFRPAISTKIFARATVTRNPLNNGQSDVSPSRLAALVVVPNRDSSMSDADLEFLCDSFSVDLGQSVVITVGQNASVTSALWRPELSNALNTAGREFGTNTRSDAATQTGDLTQLLTPTFRVHSDSPAASALLANAQERLENTKAFQLMKNAVSDANRREMQAVAEAQSLRQALAKAMQEMDDLRNEDSDDDSIGLYGVPSAYRNSRRKAKYRGGSTLSSSRSIQRHNVWNDVLSSSQSALSSSTRGGDRKRSSIVSSPPVPSIRVGERIAPQRRTLVQEVFQTASEVGVRGRSRSCPSSGLSEDDIL